MNIGKKKSSITLAINIKSGFWNKLTIIYVQKPLLKFLIKMIVREQFFVLEKYKKSLFFAYIPLAYIGIVQDLRLFFKIFFSYKNFIE